MNCYTRTFDNKVVPAVQRYVCILNAGKFKVGDIHPMAECAKHVSHTGKNPYWRAEAIPTEGVIDI